MQFRADEYYLAGLERMQQARRLHDGGEKSYALAMYCGGLAVECLLRAFRWSKDPTFHAGHDSETSLRAFLKRRDRLQRIKGDPLKKNARDLLEAAQTIVDQGVALWTSKTKSQGH